MYVDVMKMIEIKHTNAHARSHFGHNSPNNCAYVNAIFKYVINKRGFLVNRGKKTWHKTLKS